MVGLELPAVRPSGEGSFLLTLPYLLVLVAAVAGMNVLGVLTLGIIACGAVGLGTGTLPAWGLDSRSRQWYHGHGRV